MSTQASQRPIGWRSFARRHWLHWMTIEGWHFRCAALQCCSGSQEVTGELPGPSTGLQVLSLSRASLSLQEMP